MLISLLLFSLLQQYRWAAAPVGIAVVAGGLWLGGAFDDPVPTPEEQAALDDLHRMSFVFKDRAQRCDNTLQGQGFPGYSPSDGAQQALNLIESAYPDLKERQALMKFLEGKKIVLHATDSNFSKARIVFHNTNPENRVLLINDGALISSYDEGFRELMTKIQQPGALDKPGTHVLFWNEFEKQKEFLDTRFLAGNKTPEAFNVLPGVDETRFEIHEGNWKNPCPPQPTPSP